METITELAVEIKNLSFRYPGQLLPCLTNISFQVPAGKRIGLFGPNGAGKTTLMHLMTGILHSRKGTITMFNTKVKKHHKEVNRLFGFVPQDFSFYQELSPVENLMFFGAWSGLTRLETKKRTEELLEVLSLTEVRNKPVAKFSGGMKRKVNLAIGIIHNPKIIFLDEPTVGVDVHSRRTIMEYLKNLSASGTTLIYTSHQLSEAEELCEKVVLISEGRIIAQDYLSLLLKKNNESSLEKLFLTLTSNMENQN